MKIDLSQFRETFLQETAEHIVDIENGLLQLKLAGADDETLNSIFRAAHSIKGGAGAFGLTDVVKFTHVLENLFDRMREHEVSVSAELITLLLSANDVLKELVSTSDGTVPANAAEVQRALELAADPAGAKIQSPSPDLSRQVQPASRETEYTVRFRPSADMFSGGSDPLLLLRNLAGLGRLGTVNVDTNTLPALSSLMPENSYLGWEIQLITAGSRSEIEEIFEFVTDCATIEISAKTVPAVEASKAEAPMGVRELPKENAPKENAPGKPVVSRAENASVRVSTEKIDKLIDLVGELVIAHSITTRLVENFSVDSIPALQESVGSLERHIRELHERTMSVRMLPLASLFSRFHRLAHDLAAKTGKQLRLVIEGDDTEVDRSILEMLGDPLTHVLRNSADHGIETPDVRIAAGKNPEGTILLRASHLAGTILIEIIDDGAGLNLARIREKAIAKSLIAEDAVLSDEQTRLLIFEAGFSTKEEVSDLSGRGVGMDVVRRNITALNGTISLDSKQGSGTHIKIHLPLTLAIMEGLIVRVGTHNFVVPLVSILETICLEEGQVHGIAGQGEVAVVREEAIPLLRLKRLFGLRTAPGEADDGAESMNPDRRLVVVVEQSNQRAALEIDELLGQQQIVVKSLERNFTKLEGTLGATILGDGRAALILDVQSLIVRRAKSMPADGKPRMSLVA